MLALCTREEEDPKTIGHLFYLYCDEIEDIRFDEALLLILDLLRQILAQEFVITKEQVQSLLEGFFKEAAWFHTEHDRM